MKSFILSTLTFLFLAATASAGGVTVVRQRAFAVPVLAADVGYGVDSVAAVGFAPTVNVVAAPVAFRARAFTPVVAAPVGFTGGAFVERTDVRRGFFGRVRSRSTVRAFIP